MLMSTPIPVRFAAALCAASALVLLGACASPPPRSAGKIPHRKAAEQMARAFAAIPPDQRGMEPIQPAAGQSNPMADAGN